MKKKLKYRDSGSRLEIPAGPDQVILAQEKKRILDNPFIFQR